MKVDDICFSYVETETERSKHLQNNRMLLILMDRLDLSREERKRAEMALAINKFMEENKLKELSQLVTLFDEKNIQYIYLKGGALGQLLYQDYFRRICGDIDLWVAPSNYETAFSLLTELKELGCYRVGFSGGEPLLRNDVKEILEYAARLGFRFSMVSNGHYITDDLIQTFVDVKL